MWAWWWCPRPPQTPGIPPCSSGHRTIIIHYRTSSSIGISRLYWYRGVTVLLPGWVIWKYMWFVYANLPVGRLSSVRTVDLHWGEWLNSSADYNPNHNHVNAAPTKACLQATSRQHHHASPKQNYCIINVFVSIPICEIKIKKSGISHKIFKKFFLC